MELEELETGSVVNTYETVVVCDSDNYNDSIETLSKMCQEYTGTKFKITMDKRGIKKLAYPIKETHTMGYFAIITWQGTAENVTELERQMRIDNSVLKFMTVKTDSLLSELEDYSTDESKQERQLVDLLDIIYNL